MSIGLLLAALTLATAQPPPETACWSEQRPLNHVITRTLDGGFILTIAPSTDPDVEYGCRAEVRDGTGKIVFEGEGFNTRLHPESGRDVDGDGRPDLIIGIDTGGGNRCCWEYHVISLSPIPRAVARLPNPGFETDRQGRTVIWTTVAFDDLGPSMAQSPTIEIAEQFRSGRLVDITSEYCQAMLAGTLRGQGDLSAELASLSESKKAASKAAGATPVFDVDETRVAAYTVAMQLTYCGRATVAAQLIPEVWPDKMEADVLKNVDTAVARARQGRMGR
jgi:hypothetical protein